MDMSEFYQVFFEEAAELLGQMEALLLGLDTGSPALEDLNAIFRVAHSIKGGAATFGFTDMTEVTHVLESLLDKLRKQELPLRAEMVDVFLQAGDVIKDQLAGHRGESQPDEAAAVAVRLRLQQLASGEISAIQRPAEPAPEPAAESASQSPGAQPGEKRYRVEFSFHGSRTVFDNLCRNLKDLGMLEIEQGAPESAAGTLALDPCVLRLATGAPEEDVWEALAFVLDPAQIKIEAAAQAASPPAEKSAHPTQEGKDYGFFEPLYNALVGEEAAPQAPQARHSPGRRTSDAPDLPTAPAGRRDHDKIAVAAASETSSIRVSIEKVDQLINLVGELVITQSMLAQTASQVDPVIYEKLLNGMSQLERNTRDLQESVMSIRMMPISFVFSRFPRVVRDLAAKLGKQVELKTVGEGTELDKGLIEKIADPLTHLVRNSLDHGIESPEQRLAAGKPAKGAITLRAFHQGGSIVIEVSDDGAGLNRERILAKARERGMTVHDGMPDQEVWQLIFEAGFSTAAVVTDVSGRGVGMDVVRRNIQSMSGRVEIDSALGVGTCISIRLPLTLAILDGLSVSVGGELFIVPLTYIIESLQPAAAAVKTMSGRGRVVQVRDEYLPLVALHEVFNLRPAVTEVHQGIVVILEAEGRKTAMFVDALVGQHQVVIKSLETNYRRVQGVSGATIMGDGRVALILDAEGLVTASQHAFAQAA